jgi:hypothetical protein
VAEPERPAARRRLDLAVAAGCLLGAVAVFWLFRELRHDDAFITFRYARNLVRGDGFAFNPGERVLGTTTPLFTLVSAALWWVFGDAGLPTAAVAVNSLALGAQAYLLYLLLRDPAPWTGVVVAALTLLGAFGSHYQLALETNTFAALVLLTVWALAGRRTVVCGVALGLAFLTRYDAALLVPLVPVWWRAAGWRRPARTLLIAGAVVAPWLVFGWIYFGSPLPATLASKSGITPFSTYLGSTAGDLVRLPGVPPGWASRAVAVALAGLGLVQVGRRLRGLAPLLLFAAGQWLVYAAIGPSAIERWHLYVPRMGFALLVMVGVFGTMESGGLRPAVAGRRRRRRAVVFATLATGCLMVLALKTRLDARLFPGDPWLGLRHQRYAVVAEWVRAHVRPHRSFLAAEVGTLGYLTDRRMIDPYGLVTPTNRYPRSRQFDHLVELIEGTAPDLVLMEGRPEAVELERRLPYRTVWSTLLVRGPEVLVHPEEAEAVWPGRRRPPAATGGAGGAGHATR